MQASAELRSQPVLLLRNVKAEGADSTKRFALEKFSLSIGRSPDDDICLSEGSGVSRNHATVFVLDGEVVIQDLGSRNGTYVNKNRILGNRQTTLKFGDMIAIGRYRLLLVDEAANSEISPATDVQALLQMWRPAALVSPVSKCGLCHESPSMQDEVEAVAEPDTEATIEATVHEPPQVATIGASDVETPFHGRVFGRNVPRRPKLGKQRTLTRRAVRTPVKLLSRPRGRRLPPGDIVI